MNATKTASTFITVAVAALVLAACAVGADDQAKSQPAWYQKDTVKQALGLTADQVARLGEVETSFGPRLVELNQHKRAAYRKLMTSLDSGTISAEEFEALRSELETAYGTHAAISADRWKAIRGVLTEAQWRQLPEAAPKALALGNYSVAKRGGVFMGPGATQRPKPQP